MSPSTQARMASSVDSGNNIGKPSVGEVLAAAFIVAWASQYSTKLKLASIVSLIGCFFAVFAHAFTSSAASAFASSSNYLLWWAVGLVSLRRSFRICSGDFGPCQLTCAARYPVHTSMASCLLSVSPFTLMMWLAFSFVLMLFWILLCICGDRIMDVFAFLSIVVTSACQ